MLVDVGSMGGPEPEWRALLDSGAALAIGFEPDEREFEKLPQGGPVRYHPYALYSESRALELYIAREAGKTSLFEPNAELLARFPEPERYQTVRRVSLPAERVRTLDSVLAESGSPAPDMIKLDVQGAEKAILEGATRALESVVALKLEVEFLELYKGQPLFADIDAWLRARGFELAELRRFYWKRKEGVGAAGRGQLAFGEALYLRSIEGYRAAWASRPEPARQAKTLKFAAICRLYGLHDWAAALTGERPESRLSCNRLSRLLARLSRRLASSERGFADADPPLGA